MLQLPLQLARGYHTLVYKAIHCFIQNIIGRAFSGTTQSRRDESDSADHHMHPSGAATANAVCHGSDWGQSGIEIHLRIVRSSNADCNQSEYITVMYVNLDIQNLHVFPSSSPCSVLGQYAVKGKHYQRTVGVL